MNKRQYHYFISGLPELSLDDRKLWISLGSLKELMEEHLHPDDFRQVKLVFLKDDHQNMINFLETGETGQEGNGNFTADEFRAQRDLFSAILPGEDILPAYMVRVMKAYDAAEKKDTASQIHPGLAEGYYRFIMEKGSPFLKAFVAFDFDLNNLLAFVKAGEHRMEQGQYIRGFSHHAAHLRNYAGKNLIKDPDFEFFDEIMSYTGSPSFAEEEMKYDQLRWRVTDELVLFEDFSIDRILGYLQQMRIISRWTSLEKESGENKLRKIVEESRQAIPTGDSTGI